MAASPAPEQTQAVKRHPPYLPTPLERIALGIFPAILVFGTIFSLISPDVRASAYDHVSQSHHQDPSIAPGYFARKNNIFNVIFVKRGWGWITFAFVFSLLMQPTGKAPPAVVLARRIRAGVRWAAVTGWWFFVTQWFFGPPIIDRSFRWTGGKCELAQREVSVGAGTVKEMLTAVACKAAGGKWKGGHDISGHVFLLVLGTAFLMQEVGWPALRFSGWLGEERSIVMSDGAVKNASVESETAVGHGAGEPAFNIGGKTAIGFIALSLWMLLMTAIYFHTWFEKFTGLLAAIIAIYTVYYVPRALAANELHYFPTQVTILHINSIPFQLRFSPALANKPQGPPPDPAHPRKPFDPFANPPAALFVADLGPHHYLVLNKFAVVPEHFILATKEFKWQTHLLEESDLQATLACIDAYEQARKTAANNDGDDSSSLQQKGKPQPEDGLFAFFNAGDHSGASQPHRHIQLLPIARMKDGLEERNGSSWDVLAQQAHLLEQTPFVTFSEPIGTETSPADLHAAYLRLYRKACQAVSQHNTHAGSTTEAPTDDDEGITSTGEARISYNMAMTRDRLVICPRLSDGCEVQDGETSGRIGFLALNGTVLAGTALVKSEAEWEALKKSPGQLLAVLKSIGVPRDEVKDEQTKL
ncbi:alpha-galactosidase [Trichoderma citrinoviride]|uniref:Acyl-coenzyme A diphosphatase SCS3 n=1 Tax=Trichoderma citrinoviride TaxID=58853 RepID=A0A2T4BAB7_9HYPO|nr:alpha-galactosidase [Trichoderma citrinoviride]PTB66256.1 alpha-galactosidase [Trichoderma citrinoviride]